MEKKILNSWKKIRKSVSFNNTTPKDLYLLLVDWSKELKISKEAKCKELYLSYLAYFESIQTSNYYVDDLWYDFKGLIELDFIIPLPVNLEHAVIISRNIMWEIIVFKSNRGCKFCQQDNLRVFTSENGRMLYFSCDNCFYTENIEGEKINITDKIIPATISVIKQNNIAPSKK